ncbi:hypothetical protein Bpfe_014226, partial [Biomphalaria pfeifferi]
ECGVMAASRSMCTPRLSGQMRPTTSGTRFSWAGSHPLGNDLGRNAPLHHALTWLQ